MNYPNCDSVYEVGRVQLRLEVLKVPCQFMRSTTMQALLSH